MQPHLSHELPVRSKLRMAQEVGEIVQCLGYGEWRNMEEKLHDLKARALYLDESIQQRVLMFTEQVEFCRAYDPWHSVTQEVMVAADKLIEELGWRAPDKPTSPSAEAPPSS